MSSFLDKTPVEGWDVNDLPKISEVTNETADDIDDADYDAFELDNKVEQELPHFMVKDTPKLSRTSISKTTLNLSQPPENPVHFREWTQNVVFSMSKLPSSEYYVGSSSDITHVPNVTEKVAEDTETKEVAHPSETATSEWSSLGVQEPTATDEWSSVDISMSDLAVRGPDVAPPVDVVKPAVAEPKSTILKLAEGASEVSVRFIIVLRSVQVAPTFTNMGLTFLVTI